MRSLSSKHIAFLITLAPVLLGGHECLLTDSYAIDAQEIQLSVSALSESGQHFEALALDASGKLVEVTASDKLALARSAWALGLVSRARTLWDELLGDPDLSTTDRTQVLLSRAILELQESRYDDARRFAETAASDLPDSDLRAQFWLVIAESLKEQGILNRAELYYKRAVSESGSSSRPEALYLLSQCQYNLGMLAESRYSLTSVPTDSRFSARALHKLIEIDFKQHDFDGVLTWISEGRESYPAAFDTPWDYYSHITALLEIGRLDSAEEWLAKFRAKHATANAWYTLAEAAVEAKRSEPVGTAEKNSSAKADKKGAAL